VNRLFRSSLFPLVFQLLALVAFVLIAGGIALSAIVVRKLVAEHAPDVGWRAGVSYLIPGLYGGAFAVMLVVWRLF
jgi:hypothetical protein